MLPLVPLALGGVSALMSYQNAQNKNDQMRKQNMAQTEQTRYSPWSGMAAGQINNQYADPLTAAIGGGLQGAAAGQTLGGLGGAATPANPWAALEAEMGTPDQMVTGIQAVNAPRRGYTT